MNLLYPLMLGSLAAVSLPILLHMIRRPTRNRVTFSSLLFLRTTAPRLKNRSRLEHLPLLALRCLVLCLLALAFSRPFWPRAESILQIERGRRMVILLDTSASMRRTGMWQQAVREAQSVLADAVPGDRVSLMSFDRAVRTIIGFDQWQTIDPDRRTGVADRQISDLSPGWGQTNLGQALVTAVEAIEEDEVNDADRTNSLRQIVLISDFQRGSALDALKAYEWPDDTELVAKTIMPQAPSNASLYLMASGDPWKALNGDNRPRVRVTNAADSVKDRFQLHWTSDTAVSPTDVYVPPGRSVVVRPPETISGPPVSVVLTGDDHDFDNTLYVAPPAPDPVNIVYIGDDDPNDPKGMLFYVRQAFGGDSTVASRVWHCKANDPVASGRIETAQLAVLADDAGQNITALKRYLQSGRTALLVMTSAQSIATLSDLTGIYRFRGQEADVNQYAMLGRVDFDHPLLGAFVDPRFGDFTRIHFWKYRAVDLTECPTAKPLAWYDSDAPAWFEMSVGAGSLLVWTAGWHPEDSDMALSSKFAPLLYSALEYGGTLATRKTQYFVGDAVALPTVQAPPARQRRIGKPDGSFVPLDANQQSFLETDLPGIYTTDIGTTDRGFAINLPLDESRTDAMPIESIESLGVVLKSTSDVPVEGTLRAEAHRSLAEMESQQKLWRWIMAAAMIALLIEIWLGGYLTRPPQNPEGDQK